MNELRPNMGKANLELDRCMSCGLCLSECPTYVTTGRFTSSPRGRIRLMKSLSEGTIQLQDKVPFGSVTVQEELDSCLGCMGCNTSCPADIRYSEMFEGYKKTVFDTVPQQKEQLATFLNEMPIDKPGKLRSLNRLLAIAQSTGALWLVRNTPLKYLLRPTQRTMVKLLAKKIAFRPSSKRLAADASRSERSAATKLRVGVVLGCVNDYMFSKVNLATVRVLQRLGAEVVVPPTEACCGAIHHHMGERDVSRAMAIQNCRRFLDLDVDVIAANAAGCGLIMKSYSHAFPGDPTLEKIAPKFKDIHEIIWQLLEMNPAIKDQWLWPKPGEKVTYHEACHLVHGQGISAVPLKLLQSIKELEFIPLNEATLCCGSAGTYNLFHPDSAAAIQSRKIENILDTQATVVALGNSGCSLQIMSGLKAHGKGNIKCLHVVEMIDMSWR
jgi:glycolate oxidase iron-sulfur subunit